MANIDVKEAPPTAFEIAWRIMQVVKTLVGRPMHVAIVNGLKRKLWPSELKWRCVCRKTYAAATAKLLHLLSFLGDVNSIEVPASPDFAIFIKASAFKRSTSMYSMYVKAGYRAELGSREKRGRNKGA